MARKKENKKIEQARDNIQSSTSFLEKEAFFLGISKEELKKRILELYQENGGRKNAEFKEVMRVSELRASKVPKEELEKYRILPKPDRKKQKRYSRAIKPVAVESNPEEDLLSKKEELKNKIDYNLSSLSRAREMVRISEKRAQEAKISLEEAQRHLQEAERDVAKAKWRMSKAESKIQKAKEELKEVERDIQSRKVYLVDPWFSGELPEYGKLIATEDIPGCIKIDISEEDVTMPDIKEMRESGCKSLEDYDKALRFITLWEDYFLGEEEYYLLITDERIVKIGKNRGLFNK